MLQEEKAFCCALPASELVGHFHRAFQEDVFHQSFAGQASPRQMLNLFNGPLEALSVARPNIIKLSMRLRSNP